MAKTPINNWGFFYIVRFFQLMGALADKSSELADKWLDLADKPLIPADK